MQNFIDLVKYRQSTRKYSDKPVSREALETCIEAARLAPSASNSQPWKFVVVDEPELKSKVSGKTWDSVIRFNKFTEEAPVMIVITLEEPKVITKIGKAIKHKDWPHIDIGIAAEHFCLQAAELGLGTCMIGWFNEKSIQNILNIPKKKSIALLISLGYPKEDYPIRPKVRKAADDITAYNGYK